VNAALELVVAGQAVRFAAIPAYVKRYNGKVSND
jgi:hypothetical protein